MKKVILSLLSILIVFSLSAQSLLPAWQTPPESEDILVHEGFTVSYNHTTLTPNWSAWYITSKRLAQTVTGRTDFFTVDPLVKDGPQAEYRDYSGNGLNLDRGHMAPSADFTWSKAANEQTFYLTNICPQDHALNEGLWLELEQRCRSYAKMYDTAVHVVCGPIYDDNRTYIGKKNKVEVPDAFFKAIMFSEGGTNYAAAFIMPNKPLDIQQDVFDYIVPVEAITRQTGIIPFPGMRFKEPENSHPFNINWKKPNKK